METTVMNVAVSQGIWACGFSSDLHCEIKWTEGYKAGRTREKLPDGDWEFNWEISDSESGSKRSERD